MSRMTHDRWPTLRAYWDEYGHAVPFDGLVEVKTGTCCGHLSYVAVAWDVGGGRLEYADLSTVDRGLTWEMLNDSCGDVSAAAWRRARQVPECDCLDVPEED